MAYDTTTHRKTRGPVLPLESRVHAVDGDTAYLEVGSSDGPATPSSWTAGGGGVQSVVLPPPSGVDEERLIADVSNGRILSVDSGEGPTLLSDADGNVLEEVPVYLATFSPDGRYVAQTRRRRIGLVDLQTGTSPRLGGLGRLKSYDYRWAPDGRLVVTATRRGRYDDINAVYRFVCTLPDARCRRLRGRSALFYEQVLESSSFGQLIAAIVPYLGRSTSRRVLPSKALRAYFRQN